MKEKTSSKIQAICAVVIVILTIVLGRNNYSILEQQKKEEQIQYRAYVSVVGATVEEIQQQKEVFLKLTIKNGGLTPAEKVTIVTYVTMGRERIGESTRSNSFLQPNQSDVYLKKIKIDELDLLKKDSGNFYVIEIYYEDYAQNEHGFIGKYYSAEIDGVKNLMVESGMEIK